MFEPIYEIPETFTTWKVLKRSLQSIDGHTSHIPEEQFIPVLDGHWEVRKGRKSFIKNKPE